MTFGTHRIHDTRTCSSMITLVFFGSMFMSPAEKINPEDGGTQPFPGEARLHITVGDTSVRSKKAAVTGAEFPSHPKSPTNGPERVERVRATWPCNARFIEVPLPCARSPCTGAFSTITRNKRGSVHKK